MSAFINIKDVSLQFPIYNANGRSLRALIAKIGTQGRLKALADGRQIVQGLSNINLELKKGDRLGLIGSNGAGKTTLLKTLSGIYTPTSGKIECSGRLTTLFDLGLGMEEDATGMENIFLAHYIRGFEKVEIEGLVDRIVTFADIGEFINLPIRTYSAGMKMRLAFSIATAFVPDILLIDEVFGAGDQGFVKRSAERMDELMDATSILVFTSHSTELIKQFCNRAVYIKKGEILYEGDVDETIAYYEEHSV